MTDTPPKIEQRLLRRLRPAALGQVLSQRRLEESALDLEGLDRIAGQLRKGEPVPESEHMTLRSIILPDLRPAIPVRDNLPDQTDHPLWQDLNEAAAHALLGPACAATGRIEYSSGAEFKPYGSGFLVGENLVMTNRHVADIFSMSVRGIGNFLRFGYSARINFCREADRWDTDPSVSRRITEIVMLHPWFDLALLRIEDAPEDIAPLPLSLAQPDTLLNGRIGVIGYPSENPDEDVAIQRNVIRAFDTKHVSPGFIDAVDIRTFDGRTGTVLGHDSSTLTGNSGSPLIDLVTGKVVGLHFRGNSEGLNWAVPSSEIAADQRIIDAGVTFEGVAVAQAGPWDMAWALA